MKFGRILHIAQLTGTRLPEEFTGMKTDHLFMWIERVEGTELVRDLIPEYVFDAAGRVEAVNWNPAIAHEKRRDDPFDSRIVLWQPMYENPQKLYEEMFRWRGEDVEKPIPVYYDPDGNPRPPIETSVSPENGIGVPYKGVAGSNAHFEMILPEPDGGWPSPVTLDNGREYTRTTHEGNPIWLRTR